jgi:RNA-directed DNA polymerase
VPGRSQVNGSRPQAEVKSFYISKLMVWEAFQRVKANKGAPGADGVTIEQYEQKLSKVTVYGRR